jgi:hypothetical protein
MIHTSLQRLHSKRKQFLEKRKRGGWKATCIACYIKYLILQENELRAYLRGTRTIYTKVAGHTRMFRDEPVNVQKVTTEQTRTLWKVMKCKRFIQHINE